LERPIPAFGGKKPNDPAGVHPARTWTSIAKTEQQPDVSDAFWEVPSWVGLKQPSGTTPESLRSRRTDRGERSIPLELDWDGPQLASRGGCSEDIVLGAHPRETNHPMVSRLCMLFSLKNKGAFWLFFGGMGESYLLHSYRTKPPPASF